MHDPLRALRGPSRSGSCAPERAGSAPGVVRSDAKRIVRPRSLPAALTRAVAVRSASTPKRDGRSQHGHSRRALPFRPVTREEAIAEATRRGREDPDRDRASWLARRASGDAWEVVRIGVPTPPPLQARTAREQPPVAPREDPRPAVPPEHLGG